MGVSHGSRKWGKACKKQLVGQTKVLRNEKRSSSKLCRLVTEQGASGTRRLFRHVSLRGSRSVRVARPSRARRSAATETLQHASPTRCHVHICRRPCGRHVRTLAWDASQPSRHMPDAEIRDASQARRIAAEGVASDTRFPKFETQRGFRQTLAAVIPPEKPRRVFRCPTTELDVLKTCCKQSGIIFEAHLVGFLMKDNVLQLFSKFHKC